MVRKFINNPGNLAKYVQYMSFMTKQLQGDNFTQQYYREFPEGGISVNRFGQYENMKFSLTLAGLVEYLAVAYRFSQDQSTGWQTEFKLLQASKQGVKILNTIDINLTFPVGGITGSLPINNLSWSQKYQAFIAIDARNVNKNIVVSLISPDGSFPLFQYLIYSSSTTISYFLNLKKTYNPEQYYFLVGEWDPLVTSDRYKILIFDKGFTMLSSRSLPTPVELQVTATTTGAMFDDGTIVLTMVENTATWEYDNLMVYIYPDNSWEKIVVSHEVNNPTGSYGSYVQMVLRNSLAAGEHLVYTIVEDDITMDGYEQIIARTGSSEIRLAAKSDPSNYKVIGRVSTDTLHTNGGYYGFVQYLSQSQIIAAAWWNDATNLYSYLALFDLQGNCVYREDFTAIHRGMSIYLATAMK